MSELTVESALKELRKIYPTSGLITIEINQHKNDAPFWFIKVIGWSSALGDTLSDCVSQLRAWKESNP